MNRNVSNIIGSWGYIPIPEMSVMTWCRPGGPSHGLKRGRGRNSAEKSPDGPLHAGPPGQLIVRALRKFFHGIYLPLPELRVSGSLGLADQESVWLPVLFSRV